MTFYLIRLKRFPARFIGKKNTSYAFVSDQELAVAKPLQEDAHWFQPQQYAKIWTTLAPIKARMSYNRSGTHTFSEYELLHITNGKEVVTPLDAIR